MQTLIQQHQPPGLMKIYDQIPRLEAELKRYRLTDYQVKVSLQILGGFSNREIADNFQILEASMKFNVTKIYKRTKVKTRSEFIVKFYQTLFVKDLLPLKKTI